MSKYGLFSLQQNDNYFCVWLIYFYCKNAINWLKELLCEQVWIFSDLIHAVTTFLLQRLVRHWLRCSPGGWARWEQSQPGEEEIQPVAPMPPPWLCYKAREQLDPSGTSTASQEGTRIALNLWGGSAEQRRLGESAGSCGSISHLNETLQLPWDDFTLVPVLTVFRKTFQVFLVPNK